MVDMRKPGFAFQRSFDQGTLGQTVQGQPDGFDDAAGDSVLTDEICYRGGRGAKLQVTEANEAFGSWGGIVYTPVLHGGDEIWYRIRTFWPTGSDLTAYYNTGLPGSHSSTEFPGWPGVLKFLRLHTVTATDANGGYDDLYISTDPSSDHAFQFIYEGEQQWTDVGKVSDKIQLAKWETYEIYLKLSDKPMSSGGDARIRVYKNGALLADIQDRQTLGAPDWTAKDLYVFTYWNNAAPITESMYVDDMVVTTKTPLAKDADGLPYLGMK
ncbi:Hypothetical protein A7982_02215 [Minicystis rosea]|nr:Hypothetical protein A7982_02215 [Minicystis rosea]